MSGTGSVPVANVSTEHFIQAFMNATSAETQDALKPFWMDAMRIGNRRTEIESLSPARGSFVTQPMRLTLQVDWDRTKELTRLWSANPPPPADDIPDAVAEMAAIRDRVSAINNGYFFDPYRSTLRDDNRVVIPSQLAGQILGLVNNNTDRTAFIQIINQQIGVWTVPPLRVWFTAMGVGAVANGRIRLQALAQVSNTNVHLTNYVANVDNTASINDSINDVMDALFPPAQGDWLGTHATMELFGQDDQDNPRYYKGQGWRSNGHANGQLAGMNGGIAAARNGVQAELNTALAGYQVQVQAFINRRLGALV